MIYLDNAATSLYRPPCVAEAVTQAINHFGSASRGTHEPSLLATRSLYTTRQLAARLFGCPQANRVVFTANATQALNIALYGLLNPGDRVITTDNEHNSVLRPLYHLQEAGVQVDFLPCQGPQALVDWELLAAKLKKGPPIRAVVLSHASNVTGNMVNLARLGRLTASAGTLLIVDAAQTAGLVPLDMETQHIDVLCFTGHKGLLGPQGTGGLCIGNNVEIRPWLRGGSGVQSWATEQPSAYPTRLEAGTLNGHGLAGLGAALAFVERVSPQKLGARAHFFMRP